MRPDRQHRYAYDDIVDYTVNVQLLLPFLLNIYSDD